MRILYISHKLPYPLSDGGKLRVFHHIKHLSKKHKITSLSFIENKNQLKQIEQLNQICKVETVIMPKWKSLLNTALGLFSKKPLRVNYLKSNKFAKKAEKLGKEADLIIVQALRMSQYANPKKSIIDIVDTPSLQIRRALQHNCGVWKLIWKIELPKIEKYEKELINKHKLLLFASKPDMLALNNQKKSLVLKNGTQISKIKRKEQPNSIMFLGNMEYQPNIDGVKYFIKQILPQIKKKIPNIKFYVVGKNSKSVKYLENKNIIITGYVNNVSKYLNRCNVFVAPLRLGSGIQNKVLEAMNSEIPVITTSIVNNGVEAKDGKEIIVANNPEEFANKTIELINNEKLRKKLSKNAKVFLEKNYSWDNIYRQLDEILR
jgi:polysaccharide biosynthesis protein PslH